MQKVLTALTVLFLVTACASAPHHGKAQEIDLSQLHDCITVEEALKTAQSRLNDLQTQKNANNTGNAVTVAAALLALNPFMLLDIDRTDKITENMESYQKQIAALQTKQQQLCQQEHTAE